MFAVAGVSGRTGAVTAETLIAARQRVRVVVRDPAKGEPWRSRGADVAVASLRDGRALARALAGTRGAYLLSPEDPRSPDPISDARRTAHAIATAIDRSGVPHVVFLSSMGAHQPEGTGIVQGLHAAEERLAQVRASVTFLRAAYLLENWGALLGRAVKAGKLPTFIRPDRSIPMVATHDVGAFAARALLDGGPAGSRVVLEIAGPRDYSPRDLASILGDLLGRPVEPDAVPLEAVVPLLTGLGTSAAFAEQLRGAYQAIDDGTLPRQSEARLVRGAIDAETVFAALLRSAVRRAADPDPDGVHP